MTVLRRTLTARGARFGALVVVLVVLMAVLAPVLSPYDPLKQDVSNLLSAPNLGHPFGTDNTGRDVLSRVIWGTRVSLARHILPNAATPILVQASLSVGFAILAEASLSFLGLGVQPPEPSWGSMINAARGYLQQAPWLVFGPGAALFVTVLGLNFLGDGIRDALDPRVAARVRNRPAENARLQRQASGREAAAMARDKRVVAAK